MENGYLDVSYGRYVSLPQAVLDERVARMRALMARHDLGMMLICEPDRGGYRAWLTGTCNLDRFSSGGIMIGRTGSVYLVRGDLLSDEAPLSVEDAYCEQSFETPYRRVETNGFRADVVRRTMNGRARMGVVHGLQMRAELADFLQSTLGRAEYLDLTTEADREKARKTPADTAVMTALAEQMDRLFGAAGAILQPGVLEREAVNALRAQAYRLGCYGNDDGVSCHMKLVSHPDGVPDAGQALIYPGRVLRVGDRVDLTACCVGQDSCYGYLSRSFFLACKPLTATRRLWRAAMAAQAAAAQCLCPGATLRQAEERAAEVLKDYGFECGQSRMIYGIGYAMQEPPWRDDDSREWPLEENTTLVIAPAPRDALGETLCCGDTYAVKAGGARRLGGAPRQLIVV